VLIDAAGEKIHDDEAAEVAAFYFRLELGAAGFKVFAGVAEKDGGFGHGAANGADAAAGGLDDAAEDGT